MTLFNGYVAVDWSSSIKPVYGKDSIWIAICNAHGEPRLENPGTRQEAMDIIGTLLDAAERESRRLIFGFDFPFGYPEGTAQILTHQTGWQAVWKRIGQVIEDNHDNTNNRFEAAAMLNDCFQGEGPFWGLPNGWEVQGLLRTKPRYGWGQNLPPRLRYAEGLVPRAHEVWKLYYSGCVGSQALTGIARLQELRRDRIDVQVWPFETLGQGKSHVLAEIYPSLIGHCPNHSVRDAGQVETAAVAFRALDRKKQLVQYLAAPNGMPARVRLEEGAIFGMHDQRGFQAAAAQVMPSCHIH